MGELITASSPQAHSPFTLMKPFYTPCKCSPLADRPRGRTIALVTFFAIAALTLRTSYAQSAPTQPAPPPATKPADTKPADATPPTPAELLIRTPSRLIGPEESAEYLKAVSAILSIRSRTTDPFGQPQDPSAKPVIKPTLSTNRRPTQTQVTPFTEIVRLIKVTTVMPGEQRFLIGNRSIKQGDRIPLSYRGKSITAEVTSVSSKRIQFRHVESGETADLSLNMLPPGMKPGNDGIQAPGLTPNSPNAPIDLDGGNFRP